MSLLRVVLMIPSAVHRQKICEDLNSAIDSIDIQSCSNERLAFSKIQHVLPHCLIISDQADLVNLPDFKNWVDSHLNKIILLKTHRSSGFKLNSCACELTFPTQISDDEWMTFIETLHDALTTLYEMGKKYSVRIKPFQLQPPKLVVIGASTGGGSAIQDLLRNLSKPTCPVIVGQHLPSFANDHFLMQIGRFCTVPTQLLTDKQNITPNTVWLIPGGYQAELYEKKGMLFAHIFEDKRTYSYHPSIDHFFYSVCDLNYQLLGILLTGMGADGAHGLRELKDQGAETWAQDEGSMISSMPQAALQLGGVQHQLSIQSMQHRLKHWISQ
jgi:two-component system chemotaxis response regulator CheB